MNTRSRQQGLSLLLVMFFLLLLGGGGLAAWMIGKPYMDAATVKHMALDVLQQAKTEPTLSELEIRQRLFNNINVQGFPITFDDIILRPIGEGTYEFEVDMSRTIKLWDTGSLLLNLDVKAETP